MVSRIQTITDLEELVRKYAGVTEMALDTETTGLDIREMDIMGMSVSTGKSSYYVEFNFTGKYDIKIQDPENKRRKIVKEQSYTHTEGIDIADAVPLLRELCVGKKIIYHNSKFDIKVTRKFGFDTGILQDDTMLMTYLVDVNTPNGLKWNVQNYLSYKMVTFEEATNIKRANINYSDIDYEVFAEYAKDDALQTFKLREVLQRLIIKNELENTYRKIELPLIVPIMEMELTGVNIDPSVLKEQSIRIGRKLGIAKKEIFNEVGVTFNISSPKQLAEVLFDRLGYPVISTTKTGARSTNEGTLKELAFKGYIIAEKILEFRKLNKLKTTYVDKIPTILGSDGRLHGTLNQIGTKCIVGDSLVITDKGMIPIIDGNSNTICINRNLEEEKATDYVSYENQPTIKLTTSLGFTLEGTAKHRVISNRYKYKDYGNESEVWKRLSDIQKGDRVVIPYGYRRFGTPNLPIVFTPTKVKSRKAKEVALPKNMSVLLAEFLGIYNADGSIHDSSGSYSIRISNSKTEVKERVAYLIRTLFAIEPSMLEDTTSVTGLRLKGFFEAFNLGRNDYSKEVPKAILLGGELEVIAYLRGLSLDGHVHNEYKASKSIFRLTITNERHAKYVHNILVNLGYISAIRWVGSCYTITLYNDDAYRYMEEVGSPKKHHEVNFTQASNKRNFRYSKTNTQCIEVVVKKVECKINTVHDFVLPKTHSFIANSLINHNTGRFSSSNPNLQNQPNNDEFPVRRAFVPKKGNKLLVLDWSTIEVRIMAHVANDKALIEIFKAGRDVHQETADRISALVRQVITRSQGKTLNFAILYGMGAEQLAYILNLAVKKAFKKGNIDIVGYRKNTITKRIAEKIIQGYYDAYSGFTRWGKQEVKATMKRGYVRTIGGRMRKLPELYSKKTHHAGARRVVNTAIQGGAGDLMKLALIQIHKYLKPYDAELVLTVHDEVVVDCASSIANKILEGVRSIMLNIFPDCSVPLLVDGDIFDDWAGMKQGEQVKQQSLFKKLYTKNLIFR